MAGELKIIEEISQDTVKVTLSGEVDIYTSQELKDRLYVLIDNAHIDLKIDCGALNYIDSTGLGILVGILKKVKQNNGKVYLINLKENIKKLFFITGLDKVFVIES